MHPSLKTGLSIPAFVLLAACSGAGKDATAAETTPPEAVEATTDASMDAVETPTLNLPAGTYTTDLSHSSIVWKVNHLGLSNYTARFNDFEATLDIDPNNPEGASLSVTIDPTSVTTGYPYPEEEDFDGKIANDANFLNSGEFPAITFNSTNVNVTGSDTAEVTGDLTLLGVTRPLTLDVTFNGALEQHPFSGRPMLGFTATTSLNRTNFGLDYLSGRGIGDDVEVVIQTEFGTDPAPAED
jgi:polyisoprenoid-binding protein YceI